MKKKFTLNNHVVVRIPVLKMSIRDYVVRADIAHWGLITTWKSREMRLVVRIDDPLQVVEVKPERWARALALMALEAPEAFAEVLNGRGDKLTGDILIQFAAFGEQRYL